MTTALFFCILLSAYAVQESKTCLHPEASTTTQQPATTTSKEPEPTTSERPEPTTNKNPETMTSEKPEPTTNKKPEPTTNKKPEPTTNKKPETTTNKKPKTTTTKKPETTTTKKPETTTTKKPETTTTKKPETTTTRSSSTTTKVSRVCPRGWQDFDFHCFRFIRAPMSWIRAEEYCNRLGSHLAAVTGPQEYSFLQRITGEARQSRAWLGGFNLQGRWMWIDREGFYYSNWRRLLSPRTNPCLHLSTNSGWINTQCGSKLPFICSRNPFSC